jgi:hypothetical protein
MKRYALAGSLIGALLCIALQALAVTLPQGSALFETSLQSRISSTDSSMTLVSTSTASGEVLPAGYHCYTLDEGGAANANDTTAGLVEMATNAEAALGTSLGGN